MFKTPIILDKSLKILGFLNKISPINWQEIAMKTMNKAKQIISGKWRVHGNVHFEKNVDGNEFLNELNVIDISLSLTREHLKIDRVIMEIYVKKTAVLIKQINIDFFNYSNIYIIKFALYKKPLRLLTYVLNIILSFTGGFK